MTPTGWLLVCAGQQAPAAPVQSQPQDAEPAVGALEIVLRLLGQDSCRRVTAHLEQALHLLDLLLSHMKVRCSVL